MPAAWPDLELQSLRSLTETTIAAALPVEMKWNSRIDRPLKVSLRLISDDGTLVAQQDVALAENVGLSLFVPPDAVPGSYALFALVYDEETLDPLRTVDGQDLVKLTPVQVEAYTVSTR